MASPLRAWVDSFSADALQRARREVDRATARGEVDADPLALEYAAREVRADHDAGLDALLARVRRLLPGADVQARLKTSHSIVGKVARRPEDYPDPAQMEDVTGIAVVVPTLADQRAAVETLREAFEVTDDDDMVSKPRGAGYRAHHLTVVDDDGLLKEVQVRTALQERWYRWQHPVYKPQTDEQRAVLAEREPETLAFCRAAAAFMATLDAGEMLPAPEAPDWLVQVFGLPWPTVEEARAAARLKAHQARRVAGEVDPNASVIDAGQVGERLWVGSAPPEGEEVGKHFDALVFAAAQYQPDDEAFPGVEVLHVPMLDREVGVREGAQAQEAAKWVNERRARGRRVLVTCLRGHNRSALIAAFALRMGPEHMTPQHAVERMRAVRGREALHRPGATDAVALAHW